MVVLLAVTHGVEEGENIKCHACGWPLTKVGRLPSYEHGVSCVYCIDKTTDKQKAGYASVTNCSGKTQTPINKYKDLINNKLRLFILIIKIINQYIIELFLDKHYSNPNSQITFRRYGTGRLGNIHHGETRILGYHFLMFLR